MEIIFYVFGGWVRLWSGIQFSTKIVLVVNGNFRNRFIGGTLVPYKAIFWGDIPLHRPYIGLI